MRFRLVLLLITAVLFGCQSEPSLVGEWEGTTEVGGRPGTIRLTLNKNGTFSSSASTQESNGRGMEVKDQGNWKATGAQEITFEVIDVDWTFTGPPEVVEKARQLFLKEKDEVIRQANVDPEVKLKWNGDDEFTAMYAHGSPVTFRRIK